MKLSILIPTIDERRSSFKDLVLNLTAQAIDHRAEEYIELITLCDHGLLPIGAKRNELLARANGEYVAFFDDDDTPSNNYIQWAIKVIESNTDCGSLLGVITFDGENPEVFEHSLKYSEWKTTTNHVKYERYPNHLNFIRREIAQRFFFPETKQGEDEDWSTQVHKSGLIKTEFTIPEVIYHYQFKTKK